MPPTLTPLIQDMITAMRQDDAAAFQRSLRALGAQAQRSDPDALTDAVGQLAPLLGRLYGIYAKVAVVAGAFVERGASPLALCETLPRRAADAMQLAEIFPTAWSEASDGRPLPDRANLSQMPSTRNLLTAHARRRGISERDADVLAMSWFDVEDWLKAMITVMAQRDFRAAMSHRTRVHDAAAAIAKVVDSAHWVRGLSLVLDDEPLIALDPASGRGFRLTMSGVGDNFQLHTLLADRLLAPGRLDGDQPEPAWVAAATDAAPGPFWPTAPILRRFRMFDGHGAYVYPEGRPADIEPLDEVRVVVLHPPKGEYGWQNGRIYQHMTPQLTLDRALDPAEAADWLSRIAPARQTDLMANNP